MMNNTASSVFESTDFAGFLFNNLSSAIFLVDEQMRVQKINDAYKTLFSREEAEVLGALCGNSLGCSFAHDEGVPCGSASECSSCTIRGCVLTGFTEPGSVQTSYIRRTFYVNQVPLLKHFRIKTRVVDWAGRPVSVVAVDDITELEEQKQRIQDMANRDFLTGLFNRRYFFELGTPIYSNVRRGNGAIAIVMCDIDFFKRVNDTWGHEAGDSVIKTVAEVLRESLRSADIVARFGGEEFCILLQCTNDEDAFLVAEKIRLLVDSRQFVHQGNEIPVTISCGLTRVLEDSLDAMIRRADEMLYRAKTGGRNRTEEYHP